ncbi:MAG: MFS transporter [Clostridia bacterium]|nr:MFS transporter [Clostridia bacterium]
MAKLKKLNKSTLLIALCWLAYACSYIGKLSYSANINQIGEAFGISYADAGMVSTFFFFAYGIGQVVNGIFCKKYNVKLVIFASLIAASLINVLVVSVPSFSLMKYLWLGNGIAMSFLWTSLIRLLSETLDKNDMPRAIVAMGTTVATGTFIVYGMSAIFAAVGNFRVTFYVAAAIMVAVAVIWIASFDSLVTPLKAERALDMETSSGSESQGHTNLSLALRVMLITLAFFAVANNFVKDGLTSWTPDILAATYDTPGWLSILLTLLLPVMAIFGAVVAVNLQKKLQSFVGSCTVLFALSSALIGAVLGLLGTGLLPVTIGCFAIVSCLMAGVNNIITSMVPLHMKQNGANSGLLAGLLNGCCYLGSTISSYGLGAVADAFNWRAVFVLLLSVGCVVTLIGAVHATITKIKERH